MLLPSVGLLSQRTCCESPAWAPFLPLQTGDVCQLPHQLGVVLVAFLSTARGRKLPVSARSGRSLEAEPWGNSHRRAFCLEVPVGKSVVLRELIWDV